MGVIKKNTMGYYILKAFHSLNQCFTVNEKYMQ
jgi:hypothetical protein